MGDGSHIWRVSFCIFTCVFPGFCEILGQPTRPRSKIYCQQRKTTAHKQNRLKDRRFKTNHKGTILTMTNPFDQVTNVGSSASCIETCHIFNIKSMTRKDTMHSPLLPILVVNINNYYCLWGTNFPHLSNNDGPCTRQIA